MTDPTIPSVTLDGDISPLRAKLRVAADTLKKFGKDGEQAVVGMAGALGALQSKFVAVGSVLAGGAVFKEAIRANAALHGMAETTGATVESLSAMSDVARIGGEDLKSVESAMVRLTKALAGGDDEARAAGHALDQLGLKADALRKLDTGTAMLEVAKALDKFSDSGGKTALIMDILGKNGAQMLGFLRDLAETGELNAKVTATQAEEADRLQKSWNQLKIYSDDLGRSLASIVVPALNDVISNFNAARDAGFGFFRSLTGFGVRGLGESIDDAKANSGARINDLRQEITALEAARDRQLSFGSESGAASIQVAIDSATKKLLYYQALQRQVLEAKYSGGQYLDARDLAARQKGDLSGYTTGSGGRKDKEKKGQAAVVDLSFMQYYEAEMALRKSAYEQESSLRQFSEDQELAYWREIQQNVELTSKDRLTIAKRTATLELEIRRQSAKEQRDLDSLMVDSRRAAGLAQIQFEEQQANFARENGDITKRQLLELEEQYARRRFEIEYQSLLERQELAKNDSPAELARIKERMLEIERNYQMRRGELMQGVIAEQSEVWNSFTRTISGLWDKGIAAMMNGTLTWRSAWRAVLSEMAQWFLVDYVGKKVKAWVFGETAQTAVTKTGTAARTAIEGAAALKSVALWAWTAGKNIMASAWEAMAAAWKAVVGIPYIGPVLAPLAAAAAFAGVSRLAKNVASAEGGYDIPKGVNPLVQTHEEEMILPKQYANVIRGMAAIGVPKLSMPVYGMPAGIGPMDQLRTDEPALRQYANVMRGMAGSEAGSSVREGDVSLHVHTQSTQDFARFLKNNSHALAPALRQLARNFTPV